MIIVFSDCIPGNKTSAYRTNKNMSTFVLPVGLKDALFLYVYNFYNNTLLI